ncbi:AcrR family transcriptional regulator [Litorivivens lipolytica]|uniref:AcrR family transcriptional regulator n=1 Tax=Litorivivens lipolytica TaxID=1524264 RepID=A0A7W4W772_9GAMM|nr:AcrR family transcriptional regulator [Litorivivens lipolytica]
MTQGDNRSNRTKQAIIRAAENLYARHGIDGVSLNTITRTARQSNRNAIQYHFGGKNGLLQAIFDKHSPGVAGRRAAIIDELADQGEATEVIVATAMVQPLIEKLSDPDGGEAYVHISAELISANTLGYQSPETYPLQLVRETKIAEFTARQFANLPQAVVEQRILHMNILAYHGVSDHARLRKMKRYTAADTEFMASNLIDSIVAVLSMAPSKRTHHLLNNSDAKVS